MSNKRNNKKENIIKKKLFSHKTNGIDWPINSSITISLGSEDEKDRFIVSFKKKIEYKKTKKIKKIKNIIFR